MVQVFVAAPQDLAIALSAEVGSITLARADSGRAALRHLEGRPLLDAVLLDFDLPGLTGLRGIETLRAHIGDCPLGVLVSGASMELTRRLLTAGADAVLPRDTGIDGIALTAAISLLASGQRFYIFQPDSLPVRSNAAELLSDRELQVLQGICNGLQNKEIAHSFQIQEVTVKMHVRAIIRKLNARNRTQAAMIARDLGIV